MKKWSTRRPKDPCVKRLLRLDQQTRDDIRTLIRTVGIDRFFAIINSPGARTASWSTEYHQYRYAKALFEAGISDWDPDSDDDEGDDAPDLDPSDDPSSVKERESV
jgi:hypothetical protein